MYKTELKQWKKKSVIILFQVGFQQQSFYFSLAFAVDILPFSHPFCNWIPAVPTQS